MSFSSIRKHCANVDGCKQVAAALCEGCSQALCTKHFIDHRHFLGEEMNVIISEHDEFQHILNTTNSDSHPLIKQINEWEIESIAKIQRKANELRQELSQLATVHLNELTKKLRDLSEKLKEAREHDSFVETDLQAWRKSLDDLKTNLTSSSTFSINQHDRNPLVQNLSIDLIGTNELFDRVSTKRVRIEEDGQVVIHDTTTSHVEIRGKNEYISGLHKIRLCIAQSADNWTFLGINSKLMPLQDQSYNSKSACGWTNINHFWLYGTFHSNKSTSRIEMKTNDIISLIFDCDNRKISMINQRTNAKHELTVNIDNCPFPWQLHVILYEPNSCVRIFSNS